MSFHIRNDEVFHLREFPEEGFCGPGRSNGFQFRVNDADGVFGFYIAVEREDDVLDGCHQSLEMADGLVEGHSG